MTNFTKLFLVAIIFGLLPGCAAISEKEAHSLYNSGSIVYIQANNANAKNGDDAIRWANSYGYDACKVQGICSPDKRKNTVLHNGNMIVTITKILKVSLLVPGSVKIAGNDILKVRLSGNGGGISNFGEYLGIADPSDCKWDGSGVVCKSGWDYRKDLPAPLL